MTATLERRLGAVEHCMGVETGPFADFSDADLLAAIEWLTMALGEDGSETLAREDEEEAKLRAFYAQPGMACSLDLEEGWRWSYQRGLALGWERSHSGGHCKKVTAVYAKPEQTRTRLTLPAATTWS